MIQRSFYSLVFLLLLTHVNVLSAQDICGYDIISSAQSHYLENKTQESAATYHSKASNIRASTIYIPVVIHLVYRTEEQNVADDIIYRQLDILNKAFSKHQSSQPIKLGDKTYPIGKADIRFCLVSKTEIGEPSSGIIRKQTDIPYLGTQFKTENRLAIHYDLYGGSDAWDNKRYFNIWIAEMQDIKGKASIPGEPYFPEEEGVVLNINYVSDRQYPSEGLTLIHEVGHYLGLYHLWGKSQDCDDDDFVDDTPPQEGPIYDCVYTESCGTPDMYFNYMSFTPEICWRMFTVGQVERMRNTVRSYYPEFIESQTSCGSPASVDKKELHLLFTEDALILRPSENDEYLDGIISIYDVNGRLIYHNTLYAQHNEMIFTYKYPPGIYFLFFNSRNKSQEFRRKIFIHP